MAWQAPKKERNLQRERESKAKANASKAKMRAGGGKELTLPWRLRRSILVGIVLVSCSPILVPLVCLCLPFILVIFLCIRSQRSDVETEDFVDGSKKKEKKKKMKIGEGESLVLHWYLEDQLKLVRDPHPDTITL